MAQRPLSVTLIAALLILAGAVGFVYHFHELTEQPWLHNDAVWIELVRIAAIVAGTFLLLGRNWARWLAMVWIAFHVVISLWHGWAQVATHALVFVLFGFSLLHRRANEYFHLMKSSK